MDLLFWSLGGITVLVLALLAWRRPYVQQRLRGLRVERLTSLFQAQRQLLQKEFHHIGIASGKPRGLRWESCEWGDAFLLARDRSSNGYVALMEVAIQFAAVEGGDMEDVAAVALAKNATAVFFFEAGQWHTGGKAVFNLNPQEVLERHQAQYECLGSETKTDPP